MRARLPWILFFVSLALNISILAGILYVGHDKIFGGEKQGLALIEEVAKDLKLSDAQEANLRELRRQHIEAREQLNQEGGRMSDVMLEALRQETLNADAVRIFMIERGQPWRENFIESLTRLHDFLWQLDPNQRQRFLDRAAEDHDFLRKLFRADKR